MAPPRIAFRVLLATGLALMLAGALGARSDRLEPVLDDFFDDWLAKVEHLMQDAERAAFDALDDDVDRERFVRAFWAARTTLPPAPDQGPLARWRENGIEVERRFDGMADDRARALMIAGKPPQRFRIDCDDVMKRLEVWSYDGWHVAFQNGTPAADAAGGAGFHLVFVQQRRLDDQSFAYWQPADGTGPLMLGGPGTIPLPVDELLRKARAGGCSRRSSGTGALDALETALGGALGPSALRARIPPPSPTAGWLAGFAAATAAHADRLPAAPIEIVFPGYYNDQRTIVEGRIAVPAAGLERTLEGQLFDRIRIVGDVRRGRAVVDVFEVEHDLAGAVPADGWVRVGFFRRLRPGTYTLRLRVADAYGLALQRSERTIEVPRLSEPAEPPAGSRNGFVPLTREIVGVLATFPSVELLSPGVDHWVGEVEVEAVTTGGPIDHVTFLLDGQPAGEDDSPPFAATLDLGEEPVKHTVVAQAFDPAGRAIADDRMVLNANPPRFAVRLVEPSGGVPAERARVEVDVPAGETLDRVEIFIDRSRIATLRQAPFVVDLPRLPARGTTYVRAVATLASGAWLEDLVITRTDIPVDRIDVRLVELFTSVIDGRGRNVADLPAAAFTVREDGMVQTLERFDTVENLPLSVALMMDVSASMRRKVATASESAKRFFETVLRPQDRASLITFNHELRRIVPFTDDVRRLAYGTLGFKPHGTTRLHDGLVYAVHSFGGLGGKRALVVLSDGHDVDSAFAFEQVLETVLRAGVAVYPIRLELSDDETEAHLRRLAEETGGRFFAVAGVNELDQVYRQIEEDLRAQYLLVYRPPASAERNAFRRIDVTVDPNGETSGGERLRARTIHGYYP